MDLVQTLMNQLSGDGIQQISHQIGADETTTTQAVRTAVPLLVTALANNASDPTGEQSLNQALQRHNGGILDDVIGYIGGGGDTADGGAILGHVLGNRRAPVENTLSQRTGLNAGSIGKLLMMLAPLVLGALGKAKRENHLEPGSLGGYLNQQKHRAQNEAPSGMIDILTNMLDSNKDGSVLDDLGNMAGNYFGGKKTER
jgi:hypothetical protein